MNGMDREQLAELVMAQLERSEAIQARITEHLATYQRGARGPAAADLATWLHREHGFAITPSGVRVELDEMIAARKVSGHQVRGTWRYELRER